MLNCNICGCMIGAFDIDDQLIERNIKWIHIIRAIYVKGTDDRTIAHSGVHLSPSLSGTGCVENPFEHIYLPSDTDTFTCNPHYGYDGQLDGIQIDGFTSTTLPFNPRPLDRVYLFHASCYKLLEYACYPEPVNIETFNLFLRSFGLVTSETVVNWGHTYGGLYVSDDTQVRDLHICPSSGHPSGTAIHHKDPIIEREFGQLLLRMHGNKHFKTTLASLSPEVRTTLGVKGPPKRPSKGLPSIECFGKLPVELLELVLCQLSDSKDVLHARIASRILSYVPLSQAFWRSRFARGNEFEYLIEPWLFKDKVTKDSRYSDAQILYSAAKSEVGSASLLNRRRVWELVTPLASALRSFAAYRKAYGAVEPCGWTTESLWQPEEEEEDTCRWDCAHGELLDSISLPFHFGCRPLFKRHVSLESQVTAVKVSVVEWFGTTYITGLRFLMEDGVREDLGYILEDREITLPKYGGLRGFEVAVGDRGMHALSLVTENKTVESWAGERGQLKVRKLGQGSELRKVKAYFDGMKMVYLGVPSYIHNPMGPYSLWDKAKGYAEMSRPQ